MSMFKTLQNQPRIISLFASSLENNRNAASILQLLRSSSNDKFSVQLESTFPTLHQLKYMKEINSPVLQKQIPELNELLKKKSEDSIFHSDLQACASKGLWKSSTPLWVDWEKKKMGNDLKDITKLLEDSNSEDTKQ